MRDNNYKSRHRSFKTESELMETREVSLDKAKVN